MISKDSFVKALDEVKKVDDYQNGLNDFLENNGADGYVYQPDCTSIVIELLEEIFGLKQDDCGYTDISYFVYELEFGKKFKMGEVKDDDGNDLDFSSAEKLYDYLTRGGDKSE